jgi:hypothetical protein
VLYPAHVSLNIYWSKTKILERSCRKKLNTVSSSFDYIKPKSKAFPLQAWTGPEVLRRLRLPDFKAIST